MPHSCQSHDISIRVEPAIRVCPAGNDDPLLIQNTQYPARQPGESGGHTDDIDRLIFVMGMGFQKRGHKKRSV